MDVDATIEGMRPYRIHGHLYITVFYSHDDDAESVHQISLNADALPDGLAVGERVTVMYVGSVAASVTRRES